MTSSTPSPSPRYIELTGQRFGRLVALEICPQRDSGGGAIWKCQCDCGVVKEIAARYLLRPGGTGSTSCGCRRRENCASMASKYPLNSYKHGLINHPLYRIWGGIKRRCYNINEKSYPYYGAKGISMASEWLDNPEQFIRWAMANGWSKGLVIDRIDPKGNYCPENCRFITKSENSRRTIKRGKFKSKQ